MEFSRWNHHRFPWSSVRPARQGRGNRRRVPGARTRCRDPIRHSCAFPRPIRGGADKTARYPACYAGLISPNPPGCPDQARFANASRYFWNADLRASTDAITFTALQDLAVDARAGPGRQPDGAVEGF